MSMHETLYKIVQTGLNQLDLKQLVGYDLGDILANFPYNKISSKFVGKWAEFYEDFTSKPKTLIIFAPDVDEEEWETFKTEWERTMKSEPQMMYTVVVDTEEVEVNPHVVEILKSCKEAFNSMVTVDEYNTLMEDIDSVIDNIKPEDNAD